MTTNQNGDDRSMRLRIQLLAATVRGAVAGAVHTGLTWLIDQLTESE